MRVVSGIAFHAFRQRAHRPVCLLGPFFQLHAEVLLDQVAEPELALAQETRGEHGIKNRVGDECMVLEQHAQVVVRAVHGQLAAAERVQQRLQMDWRQGIDQFIARRHADLDQTNLLGIRMKAVRLGVHRQPRCRADLRQECLELLRCVNHLANIEAPRIGCQAPASEGVRLEVAPFEGRRGIFNSTPRFHRQDFD